MRHGIAIHPIGVLAAVQHGVVSHRQLLALDFGPQAVRRRARSGQLIRLWRPFVRFHNDIDRGNRLGLAGILALRFSYGDVTRRARATATSLRWGLRDRRPAPDHPRKR
ncbi:MAG: hypothetical protein ACR2HC_07220 [Thermoleophilaceae bacterium]